MTFTESIKTVFGKYATFKGRASRSEYWWWYLFNIIITMVGYPCLLLGLASEDSTITIIGVMWLLYGLATLIPNIAVTVRRLHDSNHSGWNLLWCLLPMVGGLVLLYFLIIDGTHSDNSYGPYTEAPDATQTPTDESTRFMD